MLVRCAASSRQALEVEALDRAACDRVRRFPLARAGLVLRRPTLQGLPAARILGFPDTRPSDIDASQDVDWHTHVTLEFGPHPGLSEAQKKVIALDHGMRDGKANIAVRKALLYYTRKRLGLDADAAAREAADQQIVLLNWRQSV